MDIKQAMSAITSEEWARLAKQAETTPEKLQSQYADFIAEHPGHLRKIEVVRGEPQKSDDCIKRDFSVSLFKVLGITGTVKFCGPSDDWKATVHVCLLLFGSNVWCTDYTLSPTNAGVCFNPDLTAVKAQLCVGIKGTNHCFYISGKGCYWGFGWHCKSFDETLFCFG